jgi:hypothetical protein
MTEISGAPDGARVCRAVRMPCGFRPTVPDLGDESGDTEGYRRGEQPGVEAFETGMPGNGSSLHRRSPFSQASTLVTSTSASVPRAHRVSQLMLFFDESNAAVGGSHDPADQQAGHDECENEQKMRPHATRGIVGSDDDAPLAAVLCSAEGEVASV